MRRVLSFAIFVVLAAACSSGEVTQPTTSTLVATSSTTSTIATTLTTADPGGIGPAAQAACDAYGPPVAAGLVLDPELSEISGIAIGGTGRLWVHNDSGADARLWALDPSGAVVGSVAIGVRNVDWEDMAAGPGPHGGTWLYVADIGDNLNRRTSVTIHRFLEPTELDAGISDVASLIVRYPGGGVDAEAFMVDPVTGDGFIVTKSTGTILRIPFDAWGESSVEAQQVATIDLGPLGFVTAGDISADGSQIAVRTYVDVWLWQRQTGETVADVMRGQPCRAPSAREPQGEAIAFDDRGYLTVSEGSNAAINRIEPRP